MKMILFCTVFFCIAFTSATAQKITYARPNSSDRTMDDYEIIGNYNGNILIYKRLDNKAIVSVYDNKMNELNRNKLDLDPAKIVKTDFVAYADFSYFIYQYLAENIVFCMAAKLGPVWQ